MVEPFDFRNVCFIVNDLVHDAKTCFCSTMVSSSATYEELFYNMTTLFGKTNSLFLLFLIFNNLHASSVTFSKTKSSPSGTAFSVWHKRKTTVSSQFLASHFSPLRQFLNNLLKRLSFRLSPRLPCLIRYQLNFSTKPLKLEILLPTITNILNESLLSGTVPSEFKTAVVRPMSKKPSLDPNELKNYRPISNLPFLSKLQKNLFFNNLPCVCQCTICSASISLLTGLGTAQRLFFSAFSTIFSLTITKFGFSCFWLFLQLLIQ